MTSSPEEMFIKKSIKILLYFFLILNKCSLNLVIRVGLVCPTHCIPQPPSLQVRTYITPCDYQSVRGRLKDTEIAPLCAYLGMCGNYFECGNKSIRRLEDYGLYLHIDNLLTKRRIYDPFKQYSHFN